LVKSSQTPILLEKDIQMNNLVVAALAVFDGLLTRWDLEIHASEWTRAMSALEDFFLNDAPREERQRAIANGMYVARDADDWRKVVEYLMIDPLALHPAKKGEFFAKCSTDTVAGFIAGAGGVVEQTLQRINGLEILADNMKDEITLLHLSIDGLMALAQKDAEWKPRIKVVTDLFERLCELRGGVPQSVAKRFETLLSQPAVPPASPSGPQLQKPSVSTPTVPLTAAHQEKRPTNGQTAAQKQMAAAAGLYKPFEALKGQKADAATVN
jgi:hypothetical protein